MTIYELILYRIREKEKEIEELRRALPMPPWVDKLLAEDPATITFQEIHKKYDKLAQESLSLIGIEVKPCMALIHNQAPWYEILHDFLDEVVKIQNL